MSRVVWDNSVEQAGQTFDLIATFRRAWTCPVHDRPWYPEDDEYGDPDAIHWNFKPYGCTCGVSAEWITTDDLIFVLEGALSKILKAYYLPSIQKMLGETTILNRIMEQGT